MGRTTFDVSIEKVIFLFFCMVGLTDIFTLKARLDKLKLELDKEYRSQEKRDSHINTSTKRLILWMSCRYVNPWYFYGKFFYFGFVYLITNKSYSRQYIGRKYFGNSERQKKRVKSESNWKDYYGSRQNSKKILKSTVNRILQEKYYLYIKRKEKLILKKQDSYFITLYSQNLLKLENAFYNSNILNIYYIKDYYEFYWWLY